MRSDRVALHGFGNMYKRLWLEQLENMDKIRRFIIMRGGAVESPHFTVCILFPFQFNFLVGSTC